MVKSMSRLSVPLGAALGAALVLTAGLLGSPSIGFLSHVVCNRTEALGNVTVWNPSAVVASPYLGSVSGSVQIWTTTPSGTVSVRLTYSPIGDGNVTALIVGFENWTIFGEQNMTREGPGLNQPCTEPLIGYPSEHPSGGLRHGGIDTWPLYTGLVSDIGLANGLNGSQLCEKVQNTSYAGCGVGAQFDLNFDSPSGSVSTCDLSSPAHLNVSSQGWPTRAPFAWDGGMSDVPLSFVGNNAPGFSNGSAAWYNYTFPADSGVWQYQDLGETYATGAGLVFSYSPCT